MRTMATLDFKRLVWITDNTSFCKPRHSLRHRFRLRLISRARMDLKQLAVGSLCTSSLDGLITYVCEKIARSAEVQNELTVWFVVVQAACCSIFLRCMLRLLSRTLTRSQSRGS